MPNPQYTLVSEYTQGLDTNPTEIAVDPYWIIAVFSLDYPVSFSRTAMKSLLPASQTNVLRSKAAPLIITSDCVALSVTSQKTSHTKSLSATLRQASTNYLTEILPGDWVMAWMTNDKATYDRVLQQLAPPLSSANDFMSGLKFVGRVYSIEKAVDVEPSSGRKSSSYSLQATGFAELDTMLHIDATIASSITDPNLLTWLPKIGINPQNIFPGTGLNNVNNMVPLMMNLFLGSGIGNNLPQEAASVFVAGGAASKEAPYSYVVPTEVATVLGKSSIGEASKPSSVFAYADILQLMIGVQRYSPGAMTAQVNEVNFFTPVFYQPMLGTFIPFFPEITNRPLWEVIRQYSNPVVNEMFTCMRADDSGNIVPTLVFRQIPFTTDAFAPAKPSSTISKTKFSTLPRWVVHPLMVRSLRLGRSNATRINFVQVIGVSPTPDTREAAYQEVLNPPIRDDFDIMRHGVHTYIANANCSNFDQVGDNPSLWMDLVADWMMGMHLTVRGTLEVIGIQSPICEGDNVEFDGIVFHIEAVSHNARISPDGKKSFTTTLALSNGMSATGSADVAGLTSTAIEATTAVQALQGLPTAPMYPGLLPNDNTQYDPGITDEGGGSSGGG